MPHVPGGERIGHLSRVDPVRGTRARVALKRASNAAGAPRPGGQTTSGAEHPVERRRSDRGSSPALRPRTTPPGHGRAPRHRSARHTEASRARSSTSVSTSVSSPFDRPDLGGLAARAHPRNPVPSYASTSRTTPSAKSGGAGPRGRGSRPGPCRRCPSSSPRPRARCCAIGAPSPLRGPSFRIARVAALTLGEPGTDLGEQLCTTSRSGMSLSTCRRAATSPFLAFVISCSASGRSALALASVVLIASCVKSCAASVASISRSCAGPQPSRGPFGASAPVTPPAVRAELVELALDLVDRLLAEVADVHELRLAASAPGRRPC